MEMCRMKTRAGRSRTVAANSSSSDDDISLGASPTPPPATSTDAASSSGTSQRSGINLPASTRHSGRMTFQCKFVKV